jgi:hypothetical protein
MANHINLIPESPQRGALQSQVSSRRAGYEWSKIKREMLQLRRLHVALGWTNEAVMTVQDIKQKLLLQWICDGNAHLNSRSYYTTHHYSVSILYKHRDYDRH